MVKSFKEHMRGFFKNDVRTFSPFGTWLPLLILGGSLLMFPIIQVILALLFPDMQEGLFNTNLNKITDEQLIIQIIVFIIWALIAVIIWKRYKNSIAQILGFYDMKAKHIVAVIGSFIGFQVVVVLIGILITSIFGNVIQSNGEAFLHEITLVKFLTVVIFAPICEEIFFRGMLFDGFLNSARKHLKINDKTRIYLTVIFTSIFFSLLHFSGWFTLFITFAIGVMLAALRIKTGNLGLSIVGHMSFNLFGFLLQLLVIMSNNGTV